MADARGVRLLADLNNAFRRDPNIDEYDFLPVMEPKHNKSPLILVEHKLGLERWSVKVLFQFAYNKLMAWRTKETGSKFLDSNELLCLTRAVLLVNPDVYTAWNIRKEMIEAGDSTIADDLKLGALVLTRHPKSTETFIHRRWLLERLTEQCLSSSLDSNASNNSTGSHQEEVLMDAINVNLLPADHALPPHPRDNAHPDNPLLPPGAHGNNHMLAAAATRELQGLLGRELVVCRKAAEGYPCNYHAWSHRTWVVQHCYNCSLQLMLSELQNTRVWVSQHVSDHSGFQYRQFLLSHLHHRASTLLRTFSIRSTDLLDKEMHFVLDLIRAYPGHEALWYHRRFVFQSLMEGSRMSRSSLECPLQLESNGEDRCTWQQGQKRSRLENHGEILLLKELDSVAENEAKSRYKEEQRLAQKYLDWLHKLFGC